MMNIHVSTPEGSRDHYDTHLMCKHVYTGPKASTKPPSEPAAAAAKPPSVNMTKVHRKTFAGKSKEVEVPSTSSYNECSSERPSKKFRMASSASVMHVQPLCRDDEADDYTLVFSHRRSFRLSPRRTSDGCCLLSNSHLKRQKTLTCVDKTRDVCEWEW
jgi:hypothetical protein